MRPLPLIREVLRKRAERRHGSTLGLGPVAEVLLQPGDQERRQRAGSRAEGALEAWEGESQGSDMSSLVGEVEAALLSLPPSPSAGPASSVPWGDRARVGVRSAHGQPRVTSQSAAATPLSPRSPQSRGRRGSLSLGVDVGAEDEWGTLYPGAEALPGEAGGASAASSPRLGGGGARGCGVATVMVTSAAEAWVSGGEGAGAASHFLPSPQRARRGYAETTVAVTAAAEAGPGGDAVSTTLRVGAAGGRAQRARAATGGVAPSRVGPATVMDWASSGALGEEQWREVEWGAATAQRIVRGRGGRAEAAAAREGQEAETAAATALQAAWRGKEARAEAAVVEQERVARQEAATFVQRRARAAAAQRGAAREAQAREASEGAATALQRRARGMAARRVAGWGTGAGGEKEAEEVEHAVAREAAALQIQRVVRGRWARRTVATLRSLHAMTGGASDSGSEWSSSVGGSASTAWASGDEFSSAFEAASAFMHGGGKGEAEWV